MIKLWEANIEIKSDKTDVIVSRIKGIDDFIKEMYGESTAQMHTPLPEQQHACTEPMAAMRMP